MSTGDTHQHTPDVIDASAVPLRRGRLRAMRVIILALVTVMTIGITALHGMHIIRLVEEHALTQARAYADLVISARSWNAVHGGVYVRKGPAVETNPYLAEIGIAADITLPDGSELTLRNPSLMTREIGDGMDRAGMSSGLKLTSLAPVNPDNAPDPWELENLTAFDQSPGAVTEAWTTSPEREGDPVRFRYMRALMVDESCLECHASVGYRVGDVRGALSVSLPYAETGADLASARFELVSIAVAVLLVAWVSVITITRLQERQIAATERALEAAATIDPLTKLPNRGYVFGRLMSEMTRALRDGKAVGVILADIDDFKRVNDTCGHAAGDEVLRMVAESMKRAVRSYDLVGRIGGEEFLVVAPGVDPASLGELAERVRSSVERTSATASCQGTITISAGTALTALASNETVDALVARADEAMYRAKQAGKNRVETG